MTFMGVVGDLGVSSVGSLAFMSGGSQRRLAAGLLGHVAGGGCAARVAGTVQPSVFPFGMMGAFGLDASQIVPPVLPAGRNQDGLFVLMLRMIDNQACLVHLPLAVAHRLAGGRPFAETDFARSVAKPRLADLARLVALRGPAARPSGSPVERLATLARAYTDDLPSLAALEGMWNEHRASQSVQLVRNAQACPLGSLRDQTLAMAASLRVPIRLEARADGLPIRETLSRFGRLLSVWPAVWGRARARARAGASSRSAA